MNDEEHSARERDAYRQQFADETNQREEEERRLEMEKGVRRQHRRILRRERSKWVWMSLVSLPLCFVPPGLGVVLALGWLACCTARITEINTMLSGTSKEVGVFIFLGLFMMNLLIAFTIVTVACTMMMGGSRF